MGESMGNDESIMPYITSANIACGYHAGDEDIMKRAVALCLKFNVAIGAHLSYADRQNFGRTEMNISAEEIYALVKKQIELLKNIAIVLLLNNAQSL